MKTIELRNKEVIAYDEVGQGSHIFVMLHGNMTSSKHLDILSKYANENVRLILPDLRGFGESTNHSSINSLNDFAEDIIELLNTLNIDRFSIGGWSTGGGVAMIIAAKLKDRVNKLVLVESVGVSGYPIFKKDSSGQPIFTEYLKTKEELALDQVQVLPILNAYKNKDKETLKAIWNALIYTHNKPDDDLYDKYLDDMLTQRNLVDVDYALMYFNMSCTHNGYVAGNQLIKEINAPTLIIQGERDLVVPMAMCQTIVSSLEAEFTLMTGDWGHNPFIDKEKDICDAIIAFVS